MSKQDETGKVQVQTTFQFQTFQRIMKASKFLFGKEDSEQDFVRLAVSEKLRIVERENPQLLELPTGETK